MYKCVTQTHHVNLQIAEQQKCQENKTVEKILIAEEKQVLRKEKEKVAMKTKNPGILWFIHESSLAKVMHAAK